MEQVREESIPNSTVNSAPLINLEANQLPAIDTQHHPSSLDKGSDRIHPLKHPFCSVRSMVSMTMTSPPLGTLKKRKRDDLSGKENTLKLKPLAILTEYLQGQRYPGALSFHAYTDMK